jgi:hypothetical protein
MHTANRITTLGARWLAACCVVAGCAAPGPGDALSEDEVAIVSVQGGWLVPTQITRDGATQKLFVAIAREDVRAGKASVVGATVLAPAIGKNPFGHPEGFYRIQHHSRLPLAIDPRVRVFVAGSRDMQDATMFTLLPDASATQSGGFLFANLESATNASHQLGVGLGTNAQKKAELLSRVQARYELVASVEELPHVKLHYELEIGVLARIGFNANDPLAGTLNRNQPILVADRLRSIIAAETVDGDDPDLTTAKPCNGPVPGEPTPDPTGEPPTDDVSTPIL